MAPDFPGFGYSDTPDRADFAYTFDAHAEFLQRFVRALDLPRYAIWLHDYGSQFGLRLAMADPDRVAGLIIQNGDIYADQHGPKYEPLKAFWANPTPEEREKLGDAVSEAGFRDEFVSEVPDHLVERDPAGPVAAALGADERPGAAGERDQPAGRPGQHGAVVRQAAGLPPGAPAAGADRVGTTRRVHAGRRRAGVSP